MYLKHPVQFTHSSKGATVLNMMFIILTHLFIFQLQFIYPQISSYHSVCFGTLYKWYIIKIMLSLIISLIYCKFGDVFMLTYIAVGPLLL